MGSSVACGARPRGSPEGLLGRPRFKHTLYIEKNALCPHSQLRVVLTLIASPLIAPPPWAQCWIRGVAS